MQRLSYMLLIFALIPQSTYPTKKKKITAPTEAQQELFKDYQEKYKKIKELLPYIQKISENIPEKQSWFSSFTFDSDGAVKTKKTILLTINAMQELIKTTPQQKIYTKNLKKNIDGIYAEIATLTKNLYQQTKRSNHLPVIKTVALTTSKLSGRGQIKNAINPLVLKMAEIINLKKALGKK